MKVHCSAKICNKRRTFTWAFNRLCKYECVYVYQKNIPGAQDCNLTDGVDLKPIA